MKTQVLGGLKTEGVVHVKEFHVLIILEVVVNSLKVQGIKLSKCSLEGAGLVMLEG